MLTDNSAVMELNLDAITELSETLQSEGVVVLPDLLNEEQLNAMQRAFNARLERIRWNNFDGYEKELHRHVVQDLLTLEQGFVDIALHPIVKGVLRNYLGSRFELVEAKGWKSLPTKRDFHGWHGDGWYDQSVAKGIPKEVKLAVYLTDVRTGSFNYIKKSHRKQHPRLVPNHEVDDMSSVDNVEIKGKAGSAFLFDTSGIHRQGVPILEPRIALFYNYHDPDVQLEIDNIENYRYHPLLLNAAFLGNLSQDDIRILGFGNKTNFVPAFLAKGRHEFLQSVFAGSTDLVLRLSDLRERASARWRRMLHKN